MESAQRVAAEAKGSGKGVWTLGPLIHNRRVVHALETLGVRTAKSLADVPSGDILVLPSHGARPEFVAQAEARGIRVEDATCPLVRKVQAAAKSLREQGYEVIVVGEPRHAEVAGVVGWAGGDARVVQTVEEARALPPAPKRAVVSQTTQRAELVNEIVEALRAGRGEVRVEPTLCHVTTERQRETRELARQVDVLVVVGGRESANTRRLAEVGREMGRRVYHIEAAHEVEPSWFRAGDTVGITAGTSTPDWITEEVVARMKDIEPNVEAEAREEQGETTSSEAGPASQAAPAVAEPQGAEAGGFEPGSRVTGTVVKLSDTEALVDIGYKTEGVLPVAEISRRRVAKPADVLKEGDVIEANIIRLDEEGRPILSRKRAEEDKAWADLEKAHANGTVIEAPVTAQVKGGLVADVGTRGFIPASQVGLEFIRDLAPYVGKTLRVRVIEVDRQERKVILSEKKVLEEEQNQKRSQLLETIHEGEVRSGEVKRVTDYGAFVDIGGIDGLLHVSEMSWKRVADAHDVVKEGDKIDVKVLKVDRERGRVSLGLKQVKGDPWAKVAAELPVGTVTKGRVVSVADFGVFVELAEGGDPRRGARAAGPEGQGGAEDGG